MPTGISGGDPDFLSGSQGVPLHLPLHLGSQDKHHQGTPANAATFILEQSSLAEVSSPVHLQETG